MNCNLKQMRKAAQLTLDDLAGATGLSKGNLHAIENGQEPRMRTAHRIAAVFGCAIEQIWPSDVRIEETTITVRRVVGGDA